jgi:hypothetical protein
MLDSSEFLWKPLLEAAAQTIVGAIGGYSFTRFLERPSKQRTYAGAMDLWRRGLQTNAVGDGDQIVFDGLISPFSQLFPGNPMDNAMRWNQLYSFQGRITSEEYQAMEFFAGSDAALRIGSLNGETLVGLYSRYGFIGEGLVGVVPTSLLRKTLPNFFHPEFIGTRAQIFGRLSLCPAQHGFVAQGIAQRSGIPLTVQDYKTIYYLQVNRIVPATSADEKICTLLGSAWGLTEKHSEQYLVQYGYFSESAELRQCNTRIVSARAWDRARVFYDELVNPSQELSFRRQFIQ